MKSGGENQVDPFWLLLEKETGGLPGQQGWKKTNIVQWTKILNNDGDRIGVYIGNAELVFLNITGYVDEQGASRVQRMKRFSKKLIDDMKDQQLGDGKRTIDEMHLQEIENYIEKESKEGRTIKVQRAWNRFDQEGWPEVALWIKQQFDRLNAIVSG